MSSQHNDLIQACRYFKGETQCPGAYEGTELGVVWFYESRWVDSAEENSKVLKLHLQEYTAAGLLSFEDQDETPVSLKALLFNRFAKGYYSLPDAVPYFKEWYKEVYKGHCVEHQ